jgi:hypothetical protein
MSAPVGSLKDLQDLLNGEVTMVYGAVTRPYPFYSVLLYAPLNGLNEALHSYIKRHYEYSFSGLTGPNWLVAVVEDINREQEIEKFSPAAVYDIARYLGALVSDIPALIFFTEPKVRHDTRILRLAEFLPPADQIKDENITEFFGRIAATIDKMQEENKSTDPARLQLLAEKLASFRVPGRPQPKPDWFKAAVANAPSILGAVTSAVNLMKALNLY